MCAGSFFIEKWRDMGLPDTGRKEVKGMELQELGERIYQMRKEMHMTQEELAEALGIDGKQICKYEKGKMEVKTLTYLKLVQLHAEKTQKKNEGLLTKIGKLSPENRMLVEQMVDRLAEK